MPLPEFIDNFFTSAGEKWEDFLDWSDEKGLPIRKASDFLESRGIPPLPFFVVLIFAIIVGIFLLIVNFTAPQVGVFTVTVQGPSNQAVNGSLASISFTSVNGTFLSFSSVTDQNGVASFSGIPIGANVTVSVSSSSYSPGSTQTTFISNGTGVVVPLTPLTLSTVSLPVLVQGPAQANVTLLVNGTQVDSEVANPSYTFQLTPGVNYSLTASAPGWRGYQSYVERAQDSSTFTIRMFQFGQAITGPVSAIVEQDVPPNSPITNAVVNVVEASTNKILGTLSTNGSADGSTNAIQVNVGDSVYLSASAPGFLSRTSSTYNITENGVTSTIYLDPLSTQNSQNIGVNVVDVNGNNIQSPLVNVYCNGALFAQDTPSNGVDSFNVPIGTTCQVTAFAQGYLPAMKTVTSAGVGTIILQSANSFNSGGLQVQTTQGGNPVAGVSVELLNNLNQPLGIPSQNTGPDGSTIFQYIPLGSLNVQASGQGLAGNASAVVTNSSNLTSVAINLTAAPTAVNITASDFVTGNPISTFNASSSGVSCYTTIGSCILSLPSGVQSITLTSPNYQSLTSSVTLQAGVSSNNSFVLIPNSFSQSLQLEFLGLYENGVKVNSLSPNTNYEARFILNAPTLNFSTASVYVQVGGSEDISTDPAYISSFSGNPSSGSSLNSNNASNELKWVSYNVSQFTGSQEFDVFVQTNSVSNASLNLQWSDSYTFGNNTFNTPSSGFNSQSIPITFQGNCVDGMCVQFYFSGVLGSGLNGFQALTPETFKLNYNILSNSSTPVLIQTNSSGLQLVQAVQNGQTVPAQDNTLSFNSNGSGFVLIKALSPVNNGLISVSAGSYSTQLGVRVIASNYNLQVSYAPTNLKALDQSTINFTVTDSNGLAVSNADVELTGVLDNPTQAVYANGVYTATITPNAPGLLYFKITSPGYKTYSSSINVGVDNIIAVTPTTLSLSVNSLNFSTVDFQTQNLLNQNTFLTFQTVAFSPQYTVVSTTSSSATVQPLGSFTNSLQAAVSSAVQLAALQTKTLSESVKGYVNVIARTGGYTQTIQLPFTVQTSYTQTSIQQAVSLSASALTFQVILPMQPSSSQNEIITNNAPFPVLVNSQTSSGDFQVSPLSATIPAGGSQTFSVTAYLPWEYQQLQCVVSQAPETGTVNFYASAEGVSSQALPVTLSSTIQSYGTCQIAGGLVVKLPFAAVFMLPPGSTSGQQSQQDGSVPVLTPQGLIIFQFGSGIQQNFVSVPAGTGVELPPNLVSTSSTETDVTYPMPVLISVGSAKTITNGDGSVSLTTDSGTLILPSGSQSESNQNLNYNQFFGSSYTPFATQAGVTSTQLTNTYSNYYNPNLVNQFGFSSTVQPFNYVQNGYLVPAGSTIKFTSSSNLLTSLTFDYSAYGKVMVGGVSENSGSAVPTNGGFDITFPKCAQLKVFNAQINPGLKLSDTLPAAKEVILENAEQVSGGYQVQGKIQIKECTDVDESLKYFTTILPSPLYFNFPAITRTGAGTYDFGTCSTLNVTSGSIPIMQATKVIFKSNYQEQQDKSGNWIVSADSSAVVSILPCGVGGVVQVSPPNSVGVSFNNKPVSPINQVNFTLASDQRSQSQELTLTNYADSTLHPAGQSDSNGLATYIQSIDGTLTNFFTIDSLQAKNPPLFPDLSPTNPNQLKLTATDVVDGICLPDKTYSGAITIALQGSNQIVKQIYVTVNTKSAGCASNSGLASALTNFSITPNQIFLKNASSQYFTFVSFTNNLRQPVKIQMKPSEAIQCTFNDYTATSLNLRENENHLDSGFAITANCSGLKPTANNQVFFNAVDPSTNKVLATANLTVTTFTVPQNEQNFYTSTPIGSLAPLGNPASFTVCENQFCDYNQTGQAIQDFLNQTTKFINQSFPTPQTVTNYCSNSLQNNNGKPWTTSAVLLMANTNENLQDVLNGLGSVVQQYGLSPTAYTPGSGNDLTGCGLFEVTAKYNLCTKLQGPDWKKTASVQVDVQKLESCPQTIADSPLFFMGNVSDPNNDFWVGDQPAQFQGLFSFKAGYPPISIGSYISSTSDPSDLNTASSLLGAFYQSSQNAQLNIKTAAFYNYPTYCWKSAGEIATGTVIAILGEQVAKAILTGGFSGFWSVLKDAFSSSGLTFLSTCIAGQASAITGTECDAANTCVRGAVAAGIAGFAPSCGINTLGQAAFSAGGVAIGSAISGGLSSNTMASKAAPVLSVAVPIGVSSTYVGVAANSLLLKVEGYLLQNQNKDLFNALKTQYKTNEPSEIANKLITNLEDGNLPFKFTAQSDLISYLGADEQDGLLAQLRKFYRVTDINEISSDVIRDYTTTGTPNLGGQYFGTLDKYLMNENNINIERELIPAARTVNPDLIPSAYSGISEDLNSFATNAQSGLKGKVGSIFEKYKGALICGAVQIGAQVFTSVDVRPVEAVLNQSATSHLIVDHIEYYLPPARNYASIYSMQWGNQLVYLTNFCNSSNSLCIRGWVPSSGQFVLVVTQNNPNLDSSGIFRSLFTPQTPPITSLPPYVVSGMISSDQVNSLSGEHDSGNENGFGTSSPQSNVVTVTINKK